MDKTVQTRYLFVSRPISLTSSALEVTNDLDAAIESLVLPDTAIATLSPSQVENMKTNVVIANENLATAGNAIKGTAQALHAIKEDVKNKNWVALTESDALEMTGRAARDLVAAYESWLATADIPESALAKVKPRTLFKIGKAEPGKRIQAINMIKKDAGFTEGDLNKIIGNTRRPIRKQIESLRVQAELKAKKTKDKDKVTAYLNLLIENLNLKAKVEELEEHLSKAKKAGYSLITMTKSKKNPD